MGDERLAHPDYSVYNVLVNTENTLDGAYEAAKFFCIKFERPANAEKKGAQRGKAARRIARKLGTHESTYDTLQFIEVTYPKKFRMDTANGWKMTSGQVASSDDLVSITTEIRQANGALVSGPRTKSISGKSFDISGKRGLDTLNGDDNGVRFSAIETAGSYKWILTATDSAGRSLTMEMPFEAVSSGATSVATVSKQWSGPVSEGAEMATGCGQPIPDSDYLIASRADERYYLDIEGSDVPAAPGTNVVLSGESSQALDPQDLWTVTYCGNGFYTIIQKDSAASLDVSGGSKYCGANIQSYYSEDTAPQRWAICAHPNGGYRIKAGCSGMSLDITDGAIAGGTNIEQWTDNDSDTQAWVFIDTTPSDSSDFETIEITSGGETPAPNTPVNVIDAAVSPASLTLNIDAALY